MAGNYHDILEAFEFVSLASRFDIEAVLDLETGKIHIQYDSSYDTPEEFGEFPENTHSDRYLAIPHKDDLISARGMVFDFAEKYCTEDGVAEITAFFNRKGAYSRFKDYLNEHDLWDAWHAFEEAALVEAFEEWYEDHSGEINGE